jgi:hypothetical protein
MIRAFPSAKLVALASRAAAALLAAGLLWPAFANAAPQVRAQSWFVGLGLAGGSAGIEVDGLDTDREGGFGGSFRAGYAFSEQIGLGLETNAWTKEEDDVTFTFSMAAATLYFYPAEGLVLRGGVGSGSGNVEIQVPGPDLEADEDGFGFTLGAAYEFRVGRTFALGPQVDFAWMSLDSVDANYVNAGIGFTWYFVPR